MRKVNRGWFKLGHMPLYKTPKDFTKWGNFICQLCRKEFTKLRCYSKNLFCSRKCADNWKKNTYPSGEKAFNWKGGRKLDHKGYVLLWVTKEKRYIQEHRLIMQKFLKRKLERWEQVHHVNGIKDDNRISNLEVVLASKHFGNIRCPHCLKDFKIK